MLPVEVVYRPINATMVHLHLQVADGATVEDVLQVANLYLTHPETKTLSVGIFSKKVELDTKIKAGDRIEIYRSLLIDPMEKRRQRAKAGLHF